MKGLVGRKLGMSCLFTKENNYIPVTVIEVKPNRVVQVKNLVNNNKYYSIQVTTGSQKIHRLTKSQIGHFAKSSIIPGRGLWEFYIQNNEKINTGHNITVELFMNVNKVDITGLSKGKGFAGTIKRWNFHGQYASHGNSLSHRVPGSIGQNQTPGKVFKGKKMAGQLGNKKVTIQNLKIIRVDIEREILLVQGGVPGPIGGNLIIKLPIKT